MTDKYDVFISYRREGGYDTAKHLNDLLVRDGYKVSFDIDTLRSGDFDTQLLDRIDQCKDFILIVDQHAFDQTLDPSFNPKNDWLRKELAYALRKEKNVIPVFLAGVNGFPKGLPSDIVGVTKKNGPEYNRYYFNDFYKTLKTRFLHKRHSYNNFFLFGSIMAFFLLGGVYLIKYHYFSSIQESSPTLVNSKQEKDQDLYYTSDFDDSQLFIKGLKNGIVYDTSKDPDNYGETYIYKCGRKIAIKVQFYQTTMTFVATDESDDDTWLDYDFGDIGYEPIDDGDSSDFRVEYNGNQYLIGQCDMDGDEKDELIVSVRTTKDDLDYVNTGIGINIFKLQNGAWKRIGKLNTGTNILPAVAKIVNNNIYIPWMRYEEKYTLQNDTIVLIDDSSGHRVFKDYMQMN